MSRLKYIPALTLLILSVFTNAIAGNNVEISNITYDEVNSSLNFDVSWDNAFYLDGNRSVHIFFFAKDKNANSSTWERVLFEQFGNSSTGSYLTFGGTNNSALIDGKRFYGYSEYFFYIPRRD